MPRRRREPKTELRTRRLGRPILQRTQGRSYQILHQIDFPTVSNFKNIYALIAVLIGGDTKFAEAWYATATDRGVDQRPRFPSAS